MTSFDGARICGVCADASSFKRSAGRIKDQNTKRQIQDALKTLLFTEIDKLPSKLHFHKMKGKLVESAVNSKTKDDAWSMHVTPDDAYKASFTFEDGVVYLRLCDVHAAIDKSP